MKPITIKDINLHPIRLPFVRVFVTSFGEQHYKGGVLVELVTEEGVTGWGEASVEINPGYGSETMSTALHIMHDFLVPRLIGKTLQSPFEFPALIKAVRGHQHTKHGIETAVWDALAKTNDMRLVDLFSHYLPDGNETRGKAVVGVSIGIQPSCEETIQIIQQRLDEGYKRIKLKCKPGWDVDLGRCVRDAFPDVMIMFDANSAYSLEDAEHLQQLDEFNLLMLEQPLGYSDIYEHGLLQKQMQTPICLDESVKSVNDFQLALQVGACQILNLKPARVGGFVESMKIYQVAVEQNVPLWIGGMLETGVGRAANVSFASLPGITLPCDISATARYFAQDITEPPFVLNPDSTLSIPDGYGIGVEVLPERVEEMSVRWKESYPYHN